MCHHKFLLFPFFGRYFMQCAPNCTRCTISFHLCGTTAWLLLLLLSVFVLNFRYWPQCFLFSQHFWFRQMKSFTIFGRSSILFVFLYSFLFVRSLQHLGTILRCVLFFYMLFSSPVFMRMCVQQNITNLFNSEVRWAECQTKTKVVWAQTMKKDVQKWTRAK